jgi:putative ABC transport system permease protein
VIETDATIALGKEPTMMILGVDVLQDHVMREYSITDENAEIPDPLLFLAKPDSILITRTMAKREGIRIDQNIDVETVHGIRKLRVRGLLDPLGPAKAMEGSIAVMDIYAAQMAFGKEGRIDRIDVSILREEDLETVRKRIKAVLPEGYTVDSPAGRTKQLDAVISNFRRNIGSISFISLLAGMYLIYNAISIAVVHRQKEIGILRSLGAKRGQIIRMILAETLALAVIGVLCGAVIGVIGANASLATFSDSISNQYQFKLTASAAIDITWYYPLMGIVVGVITSLIAALLPALSASRITPISAIRSVPYSDEGLFAKKKKMLFSVLFLLLSVFCLAAYAMNKQAGDRNIFKLIYTAEISMLIGLTLALPIVLTGVVSLYHRFLSPRLGAPGRLAGLNIRKNVNRNAMAAGAVLLSLSIFIGVSNLIQSVQQVVRTWFDTTTRCDLILTMGHPISGAAMKSTPMPYETAREIDSIPGVRVSSVYRKTFISYKDERILLESIDIRNRLQYSSIVISKGDLRETARLLPNQDNVAVSETFAARQGIKPGDTITLSTPSGPVTFGVTAVIVDFMYEYGVVLVDSATYQRRWNDNLVDLISVVAKSKDDIPAVRAAILAKFGKTGKPFVVSFDEWMGEVQRVIDREFSIMHILNIFTLSIACLGIVITLLASVLERSREIGVIRSIGALRGQISRIVVIESILIGITGGLLGIACGTAVGWMGIEGFARGEAGMTIDYCFDYRAYAWAIMLSIGLSAVAGLYPARRAAKTNIVEALAYE